MSKLVYNGVPLGYLRTLSYAFGSEQDPSNTDVLWSTYEIETEGVPLSAGGGFLPVTSAVITDIQHKLGLPRKAIHYEMNDGVKTVSTTGIDAGMGPEVVTPPVITVVNSGCMFVRTRYKVRVRDCVAGNPDPVVSVRWQQTEGYDETWTCRLSTSGRLIVRSDAGFSADAFRELATPGILPNFVRTRRSYRLSENGTELAFEFDDEQRDRLPPYPAAKADGNFGIRYDKGNRTGQCDVTLTGIPGSSRKELLVVAMRIALSKLRAEGVKFHTGGSFREGIFEPKVSVVMQGMLSPLGTAGSLFAAAAGAAGGAQPGVQPPAVFPTVGQLPAGVVDAAPGIAPPVRGRIAALLVAGFRDPCAAALFETELRSGSGDGRPRLETKLDSGIPTSLSVSVGPLPPPKPPTVKDEAPYSHYECEATYTYERGRGHLPGTGSGPNGHVSQIVTTHGGRMQMHVLWSAVRAGTPPVLPAGESLDPNVELLDGAVTVKNIELHGDGATPVYAVGGWYLYAVLDPSKVNITAPVPPFLTELVAQAGQEAAKYLSGFLWRFRGSPGPSPFADGATATLTAVPDDSLANQLGGGSQGFLPGLLSAFHIPIGPPGGLPSDGYGGTGGSGGTGDF